MATVTGYAAHGAGSNHANAAPPDVPIEPRRRETPDEFRARMEEKSAHLRRFADGAKAAAAATYIASVEPRPGDPVDDVVDDQPADVAPSAPAVPRPAPPRTPARRPTEHEQRNLAMVTAYVQGDSLRDIATRFRLGQATVRSALVAAGVQLRAQGQRADRVTVETPPALAAAAPVPPAPAAVTPEPAPVPPSPAPTRAGGPIGPVELARMVADYEAGKTAPEIAEVTGRTAKNVRLALERAGVQLRDDRSLRSGGQNRREDDPALVDRVRRLYVDEGLTQAAIASDLDVTVKVVQGVMRRNGIESRPDATGVKRDPAPPAERTVRFRGPQPEHASEPAPDLHPAPEDASEVAPPTGVARTPAWRHTFDPALRLATDPAATPPTATTDLDTALAAAAGTVRDLVDAVEGLSVAVQRVQEARLAAAARSVDAIRRDAEQLLAVLGHQPTTNEGVRA